MTYEQADTILRRGNFAADPAKRRTAKRERAEAWRIMAAAWRKKADGLICAAEGAEDFAAGLEASR